MGTRRHLVTGLSTKFGDPDLVEVGEELAPGDRRILHRPAAIRRFLVPVPEGVDDERRRDHERPRRHDRFDPIGAEPDRQLAGEHVEEVDVASVNMGIGAVAPRPEPRPGRMELVPVGEQLDAPVLRVADHFTPAGR